MRGQNDKGKGQNDRDCHVRSESGLAMTECSEEDYLPPPCLLRQGGGVMADRKR